MKNRLFIVLLVLAVLGFVGGRLMRAAADSMHAQRSEARGVLMADGL